MSISIKSNAPMRFKQAMDRIERKQMPFAASMALNNTAWDIKKALDKELVKSLKNPTPFTLKGIRVKGANKSHLVAYVSIAPVQAKYLKWAIEGGTRRPNKRALLYPVAQKRNKYGNMARRAVKNLAASPKTFSGTPRGRTTPGLYKRVGPKGRKQLKLMVSYQRRANYEKRFGFYSTSEKTVKKVMGKNFAAARKKAQQTKK